MKLRKILLVNIVLIVLVFVFSEIGVFIIKVNELLKEGEFQAANKLEFLQKIGSYYIGTFLHYKEPPYNTRDFRISEKKNSNKGQIILFGCSFTYGYGLNDEETFSRILADKSDRNVYNFGLNSASPREILYFLRDEKIIDELVENPDNVEYVIYTYIPDHIKRLYYNLNEFAPLFTLKNNSLIYKKNNLFTAAFLYRESKLFKYNYMTTPEEKMNLLKLYIEEMNKDIKKHFSYKGKPAKFVILDYCTDKNIDFHLISKSDENIIVIRMNELVNFDIETSEYTISENDIHPNKKAWEKVVPALISKLRL